MQDNKILVSANPRKLFDMIRHEQLRHGRQVKGLWYEPFNASDAEISGFIYYAEMAQEDFKLTLQIGPVREREM